MEYKIENRRNNLMQLGIFDDTWDKRIGMKIANGNKRIQSDGGFPVPRQWRSLGLGFSLRAGPNGL
jgi:hypothetical protein